MLPYEEVEDSLWEEYQEFGLVMHIHERVLQVIIVVGSAIVLEMLVLLIAQEICLKEILQPSG